MKMFRISKIDSISAIFFCSVVDITSAQFTSIWTQTSNPSANTEAVGEIITDTSGIYVIGNDYSMGSTNNQWRIEKRDLTTGALITAFGTTGVVTSNPSVGYDRANAITADASGIYVLGTDNSLGGIDYQWRIEKRDLTTGALITSFGTTGVVTNNPSVDWDETSGMTNDASGIYLVGWDYSQGDYQWRIEKRDLTTGALITAFGTAGVVTSNPSFGYDQAYAITADTSGIYIAGNDQVPGNYRWHIQKRNLTTGALIWYQASNPSSFSDLPYAITADATGIYVVGMDYGMGGTDSQWRIEKRDLTTGALDATFGTAGVITSNPSTSVDAASSITVDASGIYIGGSDYVPGNSQWHIEKRDLMTGALICSQIYNPSSGGDVAGAIIADASGIYVAGYDNIPGDIEWRIEKYDLCGPACIPTAANINTSICSGDSIYAGGGWQISDGTYYDTLANSGGCDSIIETQLTIMPSFLSSINFSVCSGDSIFAGGSYQTTAGVYYDTLTSVIGGCDSIIATTLSINSGYNIPVSTSICIGDSIFLAGAWQTTTGTYYDTLTTINTCDSIIAATLSIDSILFSFQSLSFCNGDSILINGQYESAAGTFYDTLTAYNGCDSILATTLTVNPPASATATATICTGDSIFLSGSWQTTVGTYNDTLTATSGCDSILATTLTVNPTATATATAAICSGDSIFLQNTWQTTAGAYYDTINPPTGCDTVLQTNLSVSSVYSVNASTAICSGDSIFIAGSWQSSAGAYNDSLLSSAGCDSIVQVSLTIKPLPVVGIGADTIIKEGSSIQLIATGGTSYFWSPATGLSCANCANPIATPPSTTTYYVSVTDAGGCTDVDSIIITVEKIQCDGIEIFVPNIFSPNADGFNDVLFVRGKKECIDWMQLFIYDRWGEKVFESNNFENGWSGSFRGKQMNDAVFVYYLKVKFITGEETEKKGNVTIVH